MEISLTRRDNCLSLVGYYDGNDESLSKDNFFQAACMKMGMTHKEKIVENRRTAAKKKPKGTSRVHGCRLKRYDEAKASDKTEVGPCEPGRDHRPYTGKGRQKQRSKNPRRDRLPAGNTGDLKRRYYASDAYSESKTHHRLRAKALGVS
ncbi:hypothetical protein PUN28_013992 [Cardiocondyla obscurior]|uniref:Uncharacterized protein n=1 Tax=Cardiocondyla obscurior TaxID=286306 RepID=A0AAW2F961_9HYME